MSHVRQEHAHCSGAPCFTSWSYDGHGVRSLSARIFEFLICPRVDVSVLDLDLVILFLQYHNRVL